LKRVAAAEFMKKEDYPPAEATVKAVIKGSWATVMLEK
jgi:hypothetical protein